MKRFGSFPLAIALIAGIALTATAAQYPPGPDGPGGACDDTLTMVDIQNPAAPCHPASGDTVWGIRGIVTGFDKDFSPFAAWIQTSDAPWSGAQVFTGATNYSTIDPWPPSGETPGNLVIGDEIVMYGRTIEFNQMTELLDFDNVQSTNDIIIRRVARNVALPAFRIVTTTEIDWVPTKSAATAEQWEGMLVRVRQPLTVRRVVGTGIGSRSFLATAASAPSDTVCIDGFSLTNVNAPAVGTVIDSAQGIFTQVTISGVNSYRILLRDPTDLFVALPPNLGDAYPVEDNILRLVFDRDVTEASAENTANYSLGSFGIINSATLIGGSGRVVLLDITNGLSDGDNESVTASGVISTGGLPMTSPQSRDFINGVLTLAAIQDPDPAGLSESPCQDRTRFVTTAGVPSARVSYRGVVVAQFGSLYYLSDPIATAAARTAIPVFGVPQTLVVGRKYLLAGQMQEFDGISTSIPDGLTEGVSVVFVQDEGTATVPEPVVQTIPVLSDTTCDVSESLTTAEDFEAVLVRVVKAKVLEEAGPGEPFLIGTPYNAPTDTMLVTNSSSAWSYDPVEGSVITVTGLLTYRNAGFPFRLLPRRNSDFRLVGNPAGVDDGELASLDFAVSPNPARTARLTFALPREADVDLGVFDIGGRRVATLARGTLAAGPHSREWTGALGNGKVASSGVYFYRLTVGGETRTVRGIKLN